MGGLYVPRHIALQAASPENGADPRDSFHGINTEAFYGERFEVDRIHAYPDHETLFKAMEDGEEQDICIAIDNNHSGRVTTAISQLRRLTMVSGARIVGKRVTEVEQQLLVQDGVAIEDIEQVRSQEPALLQIQEMIEQHDWKTDPMNDTVQSAVDVKRAQDGKINGFVTASIASRQAGASNGLNSLMTVSPEGNATTFWMVTTNQDDVNHGDPTHAAFTFDVPDKPGSLYKAVSIISDAGINITDIDSHLAHEDNGRSFFAEVEIGDSQDVLKQTLGNLLIEGYGMQMLGMYEDRTDPETRALVEKVNGHLPDAVQNVQWNGRHGWDVPNGTNVLYVNGQDRVGMLKGMLRVPYEQGVNVLDMSRPIQAGRGFFFAIGAEENIEPVVEGLEQSEYSVTSYRFEGGDLQAA